MVDTRQCSGAAANGYGLNASNRGGFQRDVTTAISGHRATLTIVAATTIRARMLEATTIATSTPRLQVQRTRIAVTLRSRIIRDKEIRTLGVLIIATLTRRLRTPAIRTAVTLHSLEIRIHRSLGTRIRGTGTMLHSKTILHRSSETTTTRTPARTTCRTAADRHSSSSRSHNRSNSGQQPQPQQQQPRPQQQPQQPHGDQGGHGDHGGRGHDRSTSC